MLSKGEYGSCSVQYYSCILSVLQPSHVLRGENRIHLIKVVLKIKKADLNKALRTVPDMSVSYIMCTAING